MDVTESSTQRRGRFDRPTTPRRPCLWAIPALAGLSLGCQGDPATVAGPGHSGVAVEIIRFAPVSDTLRGVAGQPVWGGVRALIQDARGTPLNGVRVTWTVTGGGGSVTTAISTTDPSGIASTSWTLGPVIGQVQRLVASLPSGDTQEIPAVASLPANLQVSKDTIGLGADSIGATLSTRAQVRLSLSDGRPITGARVKFVVHMGAGAVADLPVLTDSTGLAATEWRLGDTAGVQEIAAYILPFGAEVPPAKVFRATALPGNAIRMAAPRDTIVFNALGDTLSPVIDLRDRAGNLVAGPMQLTSSSPSIVATTSDLDLVSVQNGVGQVVVHSGPASFPVPVRVAQVAAGVKVRTKSSLLHWLGATTQLVADVLDRRGTPISTIAPSWSSSAAGIAGVDSAGRVRAYATGAALAVAEYSGFADTATVGVDQAPATMVVTRAVDTLDLDQKVRLPVQVFDSGGSVIPAPPLTVRFDDPSVLAPVAPDTLAATFPGVAQVTVSSGPAVGTLQVTVEGVAVLVDGIRNSDLSDVTGARTIELNNGRIRLRWREKLTEAGGFEMDTRMDRTWFAANVRGAGDWLYVTSSVVTEPTSISIVQNSQGQVGVAMRFGNHWFDPVLAGYPSSYQEEPFPFTRTIWLNSREYGYYSWTAIERTMTWTGLEFEVGFGGMFGPATIQTGNVLILTDTLTRLARFNVVSVPDAATFDLYGDPLLRVLVPLPEAPMISPVFPGWGYGSVYVHRHDYQSYGAYVYAAPRGAAASGHDICQAAWGNAPFPLRTLTAAELGGCGAN
jgi:hypothetical protein